MGNFLVSITARVTTLIIISIVVAISAAALTNKGTWYRNGNAIHMEFPDYYPVEATVAGSSMTGSWKSGAYKFTLKRVQ